MAVYVTKEARRSILVDLLTVHCLGGKAIVFTQTKREADEVAASLSLVHPCEVGPHTAAFQVLFSEKAPRKARQCCLPCTDGAFHGSPLYPDLQLSLSCTAVAS